MTKALVSHSRNGKKAKLNFKDAAFYFGLLLFPLAQFLIFYVVVNVNSILLCFQKYENGNFVFLGWDKLFKNFKDIFQLQTLYGVDIGKYFLNSFYIWLASLVFGTFLAVIFSYYIYKKRTFCNFFKFFLFLPSVIPTILLTTIYKNFLSDVVQSICELNGMTFDLNKGLIDSGSNTAFFLILAYAIWISFGSQVLFYTNAMSSISPAVMEASEVDGCGTMRQLWSVVIPMIMPTIGTFLISSIAGFFINQGLMFNFYGTISNGTNLGNIGWFIYSNAAPGNYDQYPMMSAFGICCSFIAIPAVFLLKQFLKRFDR